MNILLISISIHSLHRNDVDKYEKIECPAALTHSRFLPLNIFRIL